MKNISLTIIIITMLASCYNNKPEEEASKKPALQNLTWLCATWQNTSEYVVFTES